MIKGLVSIIITLISMYSFHTIACDVEYLNEDSVLIGDRMFSISENLFIEPSSALDHTIAAYNKANILTHYLTPLTIKSSKGRVEVRYKLEDQILKDIRWVTLGKKIGTTCTWKEGKVFIENKITKENWNGDVEVLSAKFNKTISNLEIIILEKCDMANYELTYLDESNGGKQREFYFRLTRNSSSSSSICTSDYSQKIRILSPLEKSIINSYGKVTVVGSNSSIASVDLLK